MAKTICLNYKVTISSVIATLVKHLVIRCKDNQCKSNQIKSNVNNFPHFFI